MAHGILTLVRSSSPSLRCACARRCCGFCAQLHPRLLQAIPELAPFYFDWELSFDVGPWINFLQNNYWLPFAVCTLYFVLVFGGKALMANKKPFDLQGPLALWNVGLSVFSIMGALRLVPQVLYYWKTQGFDFLICGHPEQVCHRGRKRATRDFTWPG